MSEVVCYIERAERGMLPVRVRLISTRADEAWSFPEIASDDRAALQRGLRDAAAWVAERLAAHSRDALGAVVLDADGSLCSWVSTPSSDPDTIGAMLRHAGAPGPEEDSLHTMTGSPPHLSLATDVHISGGASVQPLGADAAPPEGGTGAAVLRRPAQGAGQVRQRLGVLVVPDATVRLFLDELDARGVTAGRTVTVWHALAEAFGGPGGAGRAERVVAESSATTAQLLVDRAGSRLLWVWAREGTPVAAGAFRLARVGSAEEARAVLERADLARLASEWIAWSTQLGTSPSRARVLLPEGAWAGAESLGESVAAVWPGATADIAFDDDPVGAVLARFADGLGGAATEGRPAITALQVRPGRQHRSMYRWAGLAIALSAVVMGVGAFVVHKSAGSAREKAELARAEWREVAGDIHPVVNEGLAAQPNFDSKAVVDLRSELERRRKQAAPMQVTPEKPILSELETLSFVLGNPDYRLERLDLTSNAVIIDVTVPNTAAYEELVESLGRIGGSSVRHWDRGLKAGQGNQGVRATFTGVWADSPRPVASAGAGS